jgi:NADH-quinone oxidoreductase subunit L
MVVRSNVIYQLSPNVSLVVATIGALTALFAGTIGLAQYDIKKVLAYSTVSQLGYMFLAAGVGAYTAAIFHVMTHAFFKALLFLGSGSVIHAMGGEQDMRKMGGLRKHLPVTYWTFLVGTLAIAGVPLFAGFFSKDQILGAAAGRGNWVLYGMGLLTAALTACYMFRALYLTFHGEFRGTHEQEHHLHESPPVMTWPLRVLAVGAVIAGYVGIPLAMTFDTIDLNNFDHLLSDVLVKIPGLESPEHHGLAFELILISASIAAAGLGIFIAWRIWGRRWMAGEEALVASAPAAHRVLENKYYVDEIYDATVIRGYWALARGLYRFDAAFIDGFLVNGTRNVTVHALSLGSSLFDKYVVDGLVNLTGRILDGFSRGLRRLQTGYVANYALILAMGMFALAVFYMMVLRRG